MKTEQYTIKLGNKMERRNKYNYSSFCYNRNTKKKHKLRVSIKW